MKRSIDSDDVALSKELLEVFDSTSVDLLLSFGGQILVIVVCETLRNSQYLRVEGGNEEDVQSSSLQSKGRSRSRTR